MNQYTTNQLIGSTVGEWEGNNPVCPNCLAYDRCEKHIDKLKLPMGISKWIAQGKKYGYFDYVESKTSKKNDK